MMDFNKNCDIQCYTKLFVFGHSFFFFNLLFPMPIFIFMRATWQKTHKTEVCDIITNKDISCLGVLI